MDPKDFRLAMHAYCACVELSPITIPKCPDKHKNLLQEIWKATCSLKVQ